MVIYDLVRVKRAKESHHDEWRHMNFSRINVCCCSPIAAFLMMDTRIYIPLNGMLSKCD